MWIAILGGLAALGVLAATRMSSRGSPRESTLFKTIYEVHGYQARDGYMTSSRFTDEQKAREYADRELKGRPDMSIAIATIVADQRSERLGTIVMAHPPNYNPWKEMSRANT